MSQEMFWLAATLAVTLLLWFPYVLNRAAVRGLMGVFANPSAGDKPLAPWAERAKRAHANAVENLVLFAPAAIAVHVLQVGGPATAFAAALYFYARLIHYVVYTIGIPVVRTLAFTAGWVAVAILVGRLLGLL
jgi:uncharacterized MAPEG superfamily protein